MSFVSKKMLGKVPYEPNVGEFKLRLDANESPFAPSPKVLEKFKNSFNNVNDPLSQLNRYPDPASSELRRAFAKRYGVPYECTVAGNGSDELISIIMTSLFDKGETLAVANPEFSMYAFYAQLSENTVYFMDKDATYTLDALLKFTIDKKARAVVFSNPCNPTGVGFERNEVLDFVSRCPALCIVDEAYMDFWDQSILDVSTEYENLIVLRTLSKAYGAAGIRVGFAVGHKSLIDALMVARSPYNVNSMSQLLGKLILEDPDANKGLYLRGQAEKLEVTLKKLFPNAYFYPSKTNFVFMKTDNAEIVFKELLARGIAIRYFAPNYLRITASTDEDNALLCFAIEDILKG